MWFRQTCQNRDLTTEENVIAWHAQTRYFNVVVLGAFRTLLLPAPRSWAWRTKKNPRNSSTSSSAADTIRITFLRESLNWTVVVCTVEWAGCDYWSDSL